MLVDFTLTPQISKQKVLELARCQWIDEKSNLCCVGNSGTGKTHVAVALGQAACRAGKRVKFYTAANVSQPLRVAKALTSTPASRSACT